MIDKDILYLGHNMNYWMELDQKARREGVVDYMEEIAQLRAKVSFYENRIHELNKFMTKFRTEVTD